MTWLARACTTAACAAALLGAATLQVSAQPAQQGAAVPAVEAIFADASAKEVAVRRVLAQKDPSPTVLKAVRTVVSDYENVVRHYPASGFCDDALWKAARLSRDAFEEFGESRERSTALRLLKLLASQYPASKFARQAPEQITWLDSHLAKVVTPASTSAATPAAPASPQHTSPAPAPPQRGASASAVAQPSGARNAAPVTAAPVSVAPTPATAANTSSQHPAQLASVRSIRRAVLTDVVRIVIELDSEVTFHDERIDGPTRVFVDLPSTRLNPALVDKTLRFDSDTDIVRQIRVGRQANDTTRVVLEAAGVSSYSVYPLYSPFRLVIDCLRTVPGPALAASPGLPRPAAPVDAVRRSNAPAPPANAVAATRPLAEPIPGAPIPASTAASPAPTKASPGPRTAARVDLPAWATTRKQPQQPPVLTAKRLRWVMPLPGATAVAVGEAAIARAADAPPTTTLPSKPASPSTPATIAPAEPPRNLAGGLSMARQLGLGVSRIVIDPGHGGHDPGAQASGISEAELVLDVSLRLEKLLAKLPGVEVVLTRRTNDFVALQERTAMANREGADLFLSIHANASSVPAARGIETYFLNFASNQSAAAVAARENATSDQTMGSLQDVVKSIALNSKRDESRDFATYVQREMLDSLRDANRTVRDLGVKQAPFVVLVGASMPSVLAEISFLTNPQEAKLLKSSSYRQRIAEALFEGVRKYQVSLKNVGAVAQQN